MRRRGVADSSFPLLGRNGAGEDSSSLSFAETGPVEWIPSPSRSLSHHPIAWKGYSLNSSGYHI